MTIMMDRLGGGTEQEGDKGMTAEETVMTTETGKGDIPVTVDVSPSETVAITLTDGLADADVTVNGEPGAPSEADGNIEVIMPEDGEVTIVVESKQADHKISLAGSETRTEVRSSTSNSESSTTSTKSSTSVSTSTSTSTST